MTIKNSSTSIHKRNKKSKHLWFYKVLSLLLVIISFMAIFSIIKTGFFNVSFNIFLTLFGFSGILFLLIVLNNRRLRLCIKNFFAVLSVIIIGLNCIVMSYGKQTINFLATLTDNGYRTEMYGLYVLNTSSYQAINDLARKNVTYLDTGNNYVHEALEQLKTSVDITAINSKSIGEVLYDLEKNNTDAILLEQSYETIINEDYADIASKLKLLDTFEVNVNINVLKSDVDITKDPFVLYVSGIDTPGNLMSKTRSDVNILVAVNPLTKKMLFLNTPRDYYVTLHSKQAKDKLTHAGLYGIEESVQTLSDLYDIKIDYYARVNFRSFIKIVDALGGISVDVPIDFCEQDSNRSFKKQDLICLHPGLQTLNGEEALALARHRKTIGDRKRGENQMLVLKAIINKAMSPSIITKYSSLINALEGRVGTNLTTDELYRFSKKQLKNADEWEIETLSVTGADLTAMAYSTGYINVSVMDPDIDSLNTAKEALRNILSKELL